MTNRFVLTMSAAGSSSSLDFMDGPFLFAFRLVYPYIFQSGGQSPGTHFIDGGEV